MKKIIYVMVIMYAFFISNSVKAADVTNSFTVNNVKICSDASCSTVYDENNPIDASFTFAVQINWSFSSSEPIKDGDTVSIPFATETNTSTTTSWSGGNFSWSDIFDNHGNKIGQWRISGLNSNRKIEIKFTNYAVNKTNLNGTLITPKSIKCFHSYEEVIVPLTVYNKAINVKIVPNKLNDNPPGPYCYTEIQSNDNVQWGAISPGNTSSELYLYDDYSELTDDVIYDNILVEGSILNTDINLSDIQIGIAARYSYPLDLTTHAASIAGNFIYINSYFTKIDQINGETYNEFKSRIKQQVLSYGIYNDAEINKLLFIINFGDQPSSHIFYDNEFFSKIGSYTDIGDYTNKYNPFTITSQVANIINRANGLDNIVNGGVSKFTIYYTEKYPKVSIETPVSNNYTWTYTYKNGNVVSKDISCSNTLKVPSAISVVNGTSKLFLLDSQTKIPIKGAKFKLQKKNGNAWEDIATNLVTGEDGSTSVPNLVDGEYRYVQTEYLNHYKSDSFKVYANSTLSNVITSFILNGDGNISYATNEREKYTITYKPGEHGDFTDKTYSVYYGDTLPSYNAEGKDGWNFVSWSPEPNRIVTSDAIYTAQWEKKVKLNVHYYVSGTTTKVSDDVNSIVKVGDSYTTSRATNVANKYEFVGTSGEVSGTVGENDIEVIYYYQLKPSKLIVNYVEENTGDVLATKVEQNLHYDDTYTTTESNEIKNNYILKRIEGETSGTVDKDVIEVTYYYEKKDSKIDVSLSKTGSGELTNKNDVLDYKIVYEVNLEDYIGNGNITIIDKLPYPLNVEESNLDGGVYSESEKTITWTEEWNNIDSYTSGNKTIEKNIKIKYSNLDSTKRVMTNSVTSSIVLDNNSKDITTSTNTDIKIPSKIIVKYVDVDTGKELADTVESTSLVGDDYSLETKEFEGYNLVEAPDSEVVKYLEDNKEYIYKYKKIIFNISTLVLGNGGSITGDEPVKYGEDSTEGKIKIKADDNYFIGKVFINGEPIKIKNNLKTLTLDNFKEVKENKEVAVIFNKELENPKTGNNYIYYIIGGLLVTSITISIYIIKRKKLIKM